MFLKQKFRNDANHIMVSEEEFYEINNIERENVGYLINDYFDVDFNNESFLNKKQEMKRTAEKFHYERRARIHEFYDKFNCVRKSNETINQNQNSRKTNSLESKPRMNLLRNKIPDWFSKYNLNFIHMDIIVTERQKPVLEDKLYNSYDEEKCLKRIIKIYKDNKTRYWIDNHHYNRLINKPYKEKFHKLCCKKAEYSGVDCHSIKYSLINFYKLMEEILKDVKNYGNLWVLTYDYYLTADNFFLEIIKMFFIPNPLFLSHNELKKFISYKIIPKQKKVLALLKLWIELRPEDFTASKSLGFFLKAFLLIIKLIYKDTFKNEIKFMKELVLQTKISNYSLLKKNDRQFFCKKNEQILVLPAFTDETKNNCYILDLKILPSLLTHEFSIFLATDSDTLVQQFCLIDYETFKYVKLYILSNSYKSPAQSYPLNKIIQRYNFMTFYFILTITLQKNNQNKVKVILKFLELAEKCLKYQNYQSLLTICNALSHILTLRFKKAWDSLPEISKNLDEKIKDLVGFNTNYKKLRKIIKESKPPYIPCLNIILRDINQLNGEREWVFLRDKEFLNLRKMENLRQIVKQIIDLPKHRYNFEKKTFFYEFFEKSFQKILELYCENIKMEDIEDKLFEISKKIENCNFKL